MTECQLKFTNFRTSVFKIYLNKPQNINSHIELEHSVFELKTYICRTPNFDGILKSDGQSRQSPMMLNGVTRQSLMVCGGIDEVQWSKLDL